MSNNCFSCNFFVSSENIVIVIVLIATVKYDYQVIKKMPRNFAGHCRMNLKTGNAPVRLCFNLPVFVIR
jgi:hypothetical protein